MDQDENETTMIPRPGVYKHYKGEYYLVLTTAQHTERDEILVLSESSRAPARGREGIQHARGRDVSFRLRGSGNA
jgi:hypothetical protein